MLIFLRYFSLCCYCCNYYSFCSICLEFKEVRSFERRYPFPPLQIYRTNSRAERMSKICHFPRMSLRNLTRNPYRLSKLLSMHKCKYTSLYIHVYICLCINIHTQVHTFTHNCGYFKLARIMQT